MYPWVAKLPSFGQLRPHFDAQGVLPMGRGRQKAKQAKIARDLKYYSPPTDLTALQRELSQKAAQNEDAGADDDRYQDKWADEWSDEDDEDDAPR